MKESEPNYPTIMQMALPFLTRRDRRPVIESLSPFNLKDYFIHPMHKPLVETDEGLRWAMTQTRRSIVWSERATPWVYRTKWLWEPVDPHWYRMEIGG